MQLAICILPRFTQKIKFDSQVTKIHNVRFAKNVSDEDCHSSKKCINSRHYYASILA